MVGITRAEVSEKWHPPPGFRQKLGQLSGACSIVEIYPILPLPTSLVPGGDRGGHGGSERRGPHPAAGVHQKDVVDGARSGAHPLARPLGARGPQPRAPGIG